MDNITVAIPVTVAKSVSYNPAKDFNKWDDATWILTASFIIFTMQSGNPD